MSAEGGRFAHGLLRGIRGYLGDSVLLLVVVFALPLGILLIFAPLALLIGFLAKMAERWF